MTNQLQIKKRGYDSIMSETKGLNKNATRMLTGFIMGTIAMGCIMLGGVALLCLLAVVIFLHQKNMLNS